MMRRFYLFVALLGIASPALAQADAKGIEHFEQKIRPVLIQHCYRCHSAEAKAEKKLKAGLYLDSKDGMLKGGETGPSIVPGKASQSLLMKALHFDTLQMPPSGQLPKNIIDDFRVWIDMGAPDPRGGTVTASKKREIDVAAGKKYWAFQPLAKPTPPSVKSDWAKTAIDRFVLAKQLEKGLTPNGTAPRATLLRRAYFDLVGLPPTAEEVDAFLKDTSSDAYAKAIDRLLESERYGERWARHWLDIVRYAESGGYEFDKDRPNAYHYRDFVIRALNQDMPYDQFIRWQVAGDQLKPGDYLSTAATGFLVAGPFPGQITAKTVERIRFDQLDDMISTIGNGFLGLTVGCVRCHEHKYDPIPHADYYRLIAGLSKTQPADVKVNAQLEAYQKAKAIFDTAHAPFVKARDVFEAEKLPARMQTWLAINKTPARSPWLVLDIQSSTSKTPLFKLEDGSLLVGEGKAVVRAKGKKAKGEKSDVYVLNAQTLQKGIKAFRLDALSDPSLPSEGPGLADNGNFILTHIEIEASPLDPAIAKTQKLPAKVKVMLKPGGATIEQKNYSIKAAIAGDKKSGWAVGGGTGKSQTALFEVDGDLGFDGGTAFTITLKFEGDGFSIGRPRLSIATAPAKIDDDAHLQNAREIQSLLPVTNANRQAILRWYRTLDTEYVKLSDAIDLHQKQEPKANLVSVFAATGAGVGDVFYLNRGEVERKNGKVGPGFIQVLMKDDEKTWTENNKVKTEPRVALANWLTDLDHGAGSLLARVIVNRLWQHHFGRGIVATPNDFGVQGEAPTHPELLEYLAQELVANGWRLKPIHKMMMTSAAYMQAGVLDDAKFKIDPDNKYLWYRKAQRLEAEIIRDALLYVGGSLNLTPYGPGSLDANSGRRSIYLTVKRSKLVPMMQIFDAPEALQSIGERSTTTVATQALAFMNSPIVRAQAESFAKRIKPSTTGTLADAVEAGYRQALGRSPTPQEQQRMLAFVENQVASYGKTPAAVEMGLSDFCQVLLCLNEFVYVD